MKTKKELEKLAAESVANDNYLYDMTDDEKYHHRRGFIIGFQKAERLASDGDLAYVSMIFKRCKACTKSLSDSESSQGKCIYCGHSC